MTDIHRKDITEDLILITTSLDMNLTPVGNCDVGLINSLYFRRAMVTFCLHMTTFHTDCATTFIVLPPSITIFIKVFPHLTMVLKDGGTSLLITHSRVG